MERPGMASWTTGCWHVRMFYPKVLIFSRWRGYPWHHTVRTLVITAGLSTPSRGVSTSQHPCAYRECCWILMDSHGCS